MPKNTRIEEDRDVVIAVAVRNRYRRDGRTAGREEAIFTALRVVEGWAEQMGLEVELSTSTWAPEEFASVVAEWERVTAERESIPGSTTAA